MISEDATGWIIGALEYKAARIADLEYECEMKHRSYNSVSLKGAKNDTGRIPQRIMQRGVEKLPEADLKACTDALRFLCWEIDLLETPDIIPPKEYFQILYRLGIEDFPPNASLHDIYLQNKAGIQVMRDAAERAIMEVSPDTECLHMPFEVQVAVTFAVEFRRDLRDTYALQLSILKGVNPAFKDFEQRYVKALADLNRRIGFYVNYTFSRNFDPERNSLEMLNHVGTACFDVKKSDFVYLVFACSVFLSLYDRKDKLSDKIAVPLPDFPESSIYKIRVFSESLEHAFKD